MKHSLVLLFLLAAISWSDAKNSVCNCTKQRGPEGRILGGTGAPSDTAYPSVVRLLGFGDGSHLFCGGTILNELWIITSVDCVMKETKIIAGNPFSSSNSEFEQKRKVAKKIDHENYGAVEGENNIALVKLDSPLTFTPAVQPAKLVPKGFKFSEKYMATVVGWGSVDPTDLISSSWKLRQVDVPYVDDETCRNALAKIPKYKHDDVDCFGPTELKKGDWKVWNGPCDGDEGSPLYGTDNGTPPSATKPEDHRLIGIVSVCNCRWILYGDRLPSVYTSVRKYLWWLDRTLKANGYDKGIEESVVKMSTAQSLAAAIIGNASKVLLGFAVAMILTSK